MIVVYEPFCKGWNHVPINSDLILIISERFPNDEIFFYGEQDHLKHVRDRINNPSLLINYCNIDIVNISQGRINSVINERKNIIKIVKHNKNMRLLFILNTFPHTMFFVKKYTPKKIPIIFMLHGNLEELRKKKKIYHAGYWIKPAFFYKRKRENQKFLVLGESIRTEVLRYINFIKNDLISIPHPYQMISTKNEKKLSPKIVMGMIGSFSNEKRSELIYELENRIKQERIQNLEILLVGATQNNLETHAETNVKIWGNGTNKLDEKEYNSGIKLLDYILFFWPNDSYKMTASGAVLDAIAHRKPIIAIKTSYLQWVFETVGDIGFLCETFEELVDIVIRISKKELNNQLDLFSQNFNKAQLFFSRENVKEIMNKKDVWMINSMK